MNAANLRRQDTTKGPPLRILSLDGGGVRGYSMLILLQELMHHTYVEVHGSAPKRYEIPKPCDYFDMIGGTGTGGLIAIMLGRLRMDLETCKDVYVKMTKKVFETDKTFAGIPYRSTLFKASKLEEAIRECVREHTITGDEGNDDGNLAPPSTPGGLSSGGSDTPQRAASSASRGSAYNPPPFRGSTGSSRAWGNSNALLYDVRENRTKTAVTAVYKGTPLNGTSALLRSYDSRKEPSPEFNCTIWQAGRATSATALAFKPIQVGQSVFLDEGAGKYNPSPQLLDEAAVNEWPGRDVGVFVSIGTGKRPSGTNHMQNQWWEGFIGSSMGDFAEARRRLIAKIEGCEETHQYMIRDHLGKRGVNPEQYYRFNVEVGVGEFAMNEWNRLADISTNTRMYIAKQEVQSSIVGASSKIAKIHYAKSRWDKMANGGDHDDRPYSWEESSGGDTLHIHSQMQLESRLQTQSYDQQRINSQTPHAIAVELPGAEVYELESPIVNPEQSHQYQRYSDPEDKFAVLSNDHYPQSMNATTVPRPLQYSQTSTERYSYDNATDRPGPLNVHHRDSQTYQTYQNNSRPAQAYASNQQPTLPPPLPPPPLPPTTMPAGHDTSQPQKSFQVSPPPVPPKTPIQTPEGLRQFHMAQSNPNSPTTSRPLPYPDVDAPPPPVNMAKKPQYGVRY